MTSTTNLRNLRLKYKFPLSELAEAAGISVQHLSRLELSVVSATPRQEEKLAQAFHRLICARRMELLSMEQDFLVFRGRLLQFMEGQP